MIAMKMIASTHPTIWALAPIGAILCTMSFVAAPSEGRAASPDMAQVEKLVSEQLARKRDYQPGDLISRADVEPIFNRLIEMGLQPADRESLYDAFLSHNSFLVRELSSPDGKKFMRTVAR